MDKITITIDKKLDERGNVIYQKESDGSETWKWYYDNDQVSRVYCRSASSGLECWKNYNQDGTVAEYRDSSGFCINYNDRGHSLMYYDLETEKLVHISKLAELA